jgi:hypothetical protein
MSGIPNESFQLVQEWAVYLNMTSVTSILVNQNAAKFKENLKLQNAAKFKKKLKLQNAITIN